MRPDEFNSEIGLVGCIGSPILAALTGAVGAIVLIVSGLPLDQAARIGVVGAVCGFLSAWIPYNVWPKLGAGWARRSANDVVGLSFLVLPVLVTVVVIVAQRV